MKLSPLCLLVAGILTTSPAQLSARPRLTERQHDLLEKALEDSTLTRWQRCVATSLVSPRSGVSSAVTSPLLLSSTSTDGEWSQLMVETRSGHTAIYDPVRDRMLIFGGFGDFDLLGGVWALSLSGSQRWTKILPIGTSPPGRAGHTAIYDQLRDRMLIFGGYDFDGAHNDVWALSLSGTPQWTQLTPSGAPPERGGHAAIYDLAHDRMVIFGGDNWSGPGYLNDVWELSLSGTPAWHQIVPAGIPPVARSGQTAIYDLPRNRMLIFGGADGDYPNLNDTWALTLSATPQWTELAPLGTLPPGRSRHSSIYDPSGDRMVVYGGWNDGGRGRYNDTWALSLQGTPGWTQIITATIPPGRVATSTIYDPVRFRMIVFGGDEDVYYPDLNDVWALSLLGSPEWTLVPGSPPSARSAHSAIYDRARDRMVVFGGRFNSYTEVWAFSFSDNPAWTELTPAGLPPVGGKAIYDRERDRMLVLKGSQVSALSLSANPTWTELTPTGPAPSELDEDTATYDPVHDRVIVFGGYTWPNIFNDVWVLSLSGAPTWTQLTLAGPTPSPRFGHSAIYDPVRDRIVIFGGKDGAYPYPRINEVWALSLSGAPTWSKLEPTGAPSGRNGHTAIYDPIRDRMVVYGGEIYPYDGNLWALSMSEPLAWTELAPEPGPGGRAWHSAIYDPVRDRMLIFAGSVDMHSDWNDVWALNWGAVTAVQSPSAFSNALRPCYPNPFNPRVTIPFDLRQDGNLTLSVYDVSGRLVKTLVNEWTRAGSHIVSWDGRSELGAQISSGVYFCRLRTGGFTETRKIVMVK